jgi:hypothetical protein
VKEIKPQPTNPTQPPTQKDIFLSLIVQPPIIDYFTRDFTHRAVLSLWLL